MKYTKVERVKAALSGDAVDRPPVSLWRHFYREEVTTQGLVDSMLGFQNRYGWDFMKVNPRAQYHVEDWGATFEYPDDPNEGPTPTKAPIQSIEQWDYLEPLSPTKGSLGNQIDALNRIKKGLNNEVPFIMTVFNPISIAGQLVGSEETFLSHLQLAANRVHSGLDVITETFCSYVSEILNVGADGIFFATTAWGTTDRLTEDDYDTFGRPYDLQILEAARDAWFNVLHVCRDNNMLRQLTDYPIHAINWDSHAPGNSSLQEARSFLDKVPMGGISRENLLNLDAREIQSEIEKVIRDSENTPIIIAPNCSISPRCPEVNVSALAETFNV